MCPLLAPVFQGFFFAVAINSTKWSKQGRQYAPLSSLYYLDVYGGELVVPPCSTKNNKQLCELTKALAVYLFNVYGTGKEKNININFGFSSWKSAKQFDERKMVLRYFVL